MRPTNPQTLLRYLLAWDSSRAADRRPYLYPERILRPPPPIPERRQRSEAIDRYAPLRGWLQEHLAAWPELVVIDSILDEIPPALTDGLKRIQLANVAQHVLKNAGCKPLGQFKEIAGRSHNGAYIWAIRNVERYAAFSRDNLLKWYLMQDPVTVQRFRMKHQQNADAGLQWLRDNEPELPALAYAPDVAALIPSDLGGTDTQRVRCAARYLAELGAVELGEHQTEFGRRKLWGTRDIEKLAAMKPRERLRATL
jgi:hypothetical protein